MLKHNPSAPQHQSRQRDHSSPSDADDLPNPSSQYMPRPPTPEEKADDEDPLGFDDNATVLVDDATKSEITPVPSEEVHSVPSDEDDEEEEEEIHDQSSHSSMSIESRPLTPVEDFAGFSSAEARDQSERLRAVELVTLNESLRAEQDKRRLKQAEIDAKEIEKTEARRAFYASKAVQTQRRLQKVIDEARQREEQERQRKEAKERADAELLRLEAERISMKE